MGEGAVTKVLATFSYSSGVRRHVELQGFREFEVPEVVTLSSGRVFQLVTHVYGPTLGLILERMYFSQFSLYRAYYKELPCQIQ